MHPKFILFSYPGTPLVGTFIYGMVGQHKELIPGYGKVHGGGWYSLDSDARTITLYGSSGDYGPANLAFLNRIPSSLRGYRFFYSPTWPGTGAGAGLNSGSCAGAGAGAGAGFGASPSALANELPLDDVEWF